MKWIENITRLFEFGETGICPFCNSDDTDYRMKIVDHKTKMGFGDIWCNCCKRAFHISRV